MRGLLFAALLCAGCATAGAERPSGTASARSTPGPKHVVNAMELPPELASHAAAANFEQVFCSELYAANGGEVLCAADLRAIIKIQQDTAALGGDASEGPDLETLTRAPRRVGLVATREGSSIRVDATLLNENLEPLRKAQVTLAGDGSDVPERARELAQRLTAP
ncbi:MAG: hypothetical protein ACK4N5_13315 [Myxococcales bacterium]